MHRLDKSVSGVLVLSKSKESAKVIGKAFEKHQVGREYLAVVNRGDMQVGSAGMIEARLRTSEDRVLLVQEGEEVFGNGKEAITKWTCLDSSVSTCFFLSQLERTALQGE